MPKRKKAEEELAIEEPHKKQKKSKKPRTKGLLSKLRGEVRLKIKNQRAKIRAETKVLTALKRDLRSLGGHRKKSRASTAKQRIKNILDLNP